MNPSRTKNITADTLMRDSNRHIVRVICDDIVKIVDELVLQTHRQGSSKIEYELPTTFDINGMTKQDAQIMIYSELIKIYETDKKYIDVELDMNQPKKVFLRMRWLNGMDENERQRRKKIIMEHLYKPASISRSKHVDE